jgi:hypothetical protein
MSGLLLDERLLCYQPALVRRLGLAEAAIVQQLHYWAQRATNIYEGERWVYKTYGDWSGEIGVSTKAVRGALDRLRRDGVVVAMQSPLDARDRTLWWRINHKVLNGESTPSAPGAPSAPEGSPSAAEGSSRAGVPDVVQRVRTESGERAPARKPVKIGGRPVDVERWQRTAAILAEFNDLADRSLRLLTSAGEPSEAAKRIYGRVCCYPDITLAKHEDIIRRTLASRWWGDGPPTIGVVFGPNVFEENITRPGIPRNQRNGSSGNGELIAILNAQIGDR